MSSQQSTRDLALIGAGYWGKNLARNFNSLGVLHTICDNSITTLAGYGTEYSAAEKNSSLKEVLRNPAVLKVAIAAPAALHFQIAKAALLADKDVYVEKPLCLETAEAEELLQLAEQRGRVLMVGHLLQYHPCIMKLQSLLAQGELGKLHYITSNRLNLGKIRQEENALWSFAPHDISVILSLAGYQMPEQVRCTGDSYLTPGVADTTLTAFRFAGGVRAHIYVTWLNPFKEQKLTVVGSNGMVVFDDMRPWNEKLILHRQYLTWTNGNTPTPSKTTGEPVSVEEAEPLRNECVHFLECCSHRRTPRTDGKEGLRVLRVLRLAQQSLEEDGEAVSPTGPGQKLQVRGQKPKPIIDFRCPVSDYYAHPTAVIDDGAAIGNGTKIWHFCHVMKGACIGERCILGQNVNVDGGTKIGNNVKIQNNVSIYTGAEIEDDVFLGPSCVLTNVSNPRSQINRHSLYEKTLIARGATVGANATILCGVAIGRYAFIAAGAVVTKDVPDYALVAGNPARLKGWVSRHGHRLTQVTPDGELVCPESGLRYKELSQGHLSCLDIDENEPLPSHMVKGSRAYRDFKTSRPSM